MAAILSRPQCVNSITHSLFIWKDGLWSRASYVYVLIHVSSQDLSHAHCNLHHADRYSGIMIKDMKSVSWLLMVWRHMVPWHQLALSPIAITKRNDIRNYCMVKIIQGKNTACPIVILSLYSHKWLTIFVSTELGADFFFFFSKGLVISIFPVWFLRL